MCLLIFGMLKHVMGSFRMVQRRYRLVVDFSLTPMSSRKRKKRSQKAMVDITRRVRTRSEAPLPSGTERGARGVFGQGPNQCLINRSSGFVGHFSPLALLEAIMLCLFWLLGVQFSIQATHPSPPCIVQVTSNVNIDWSDAQYSQCAELYLWDLWDIADRVAICCEMLLHSEDTDGPETAEALSKFAPQLWTSLVSHWFQKTSYMYTVLEWAAGLLERCDKQIFQPRREVWPSNPSGLAKVLLFLLRPFSSFFAYIWQFVILKKSDLDWGWLGQQPRSASCLDRFQLHDVHMARLVEERLRLNGHRLDPWLRLLVLFRYHTEVFDYHWTSQIYRWKKRGQNRTQWRGWGGCKRTNHRRSYKSEQLDS